MRYRRWFPVFLILGALLCLLLPFQQKAASVKEERIVYGTSGQGRELLAYRFGSGENVMVLGFCIHGYEDGYPQDGAALVHTAQVVMDALRESPLVVKNDWSVYVLPCMNPDGLYDGYTNDGPGRCTTTYIDENGIFQYGTGIDLNRSFPARWEACDTPRNRTGSAPLAAMEAVALSRFLQTVRGGEVNVLVDIHGWYFQTITRSQVIRRAADVYFPENTYTDSNGGAGYLSTYAAELGYESCLLEIPSTANDLAEYTHSDLPQRVAQFVQALLKSQALFGQEV